MIKEQMFQLKQAALDYATRTPGDLLENAELIYQWLIKEEEQKAKQVAKDQ